MVDAVLEEHGGRHSRLRDLPSRCGVYFVPAMCLFPEVGYGLVWRKLTAALGSLSMVGPTAKALRDLRRRIGIAPMRALYETVAGPLAQPSTPGVRHGRYRTVSFDGCSAIRLPDSGANRAAFEPARRLADAPADDPGRDRHPGTDRLVLRSTQRGRGGLRPPPAAPVDAGHAPAVGQRLRWQRLPRRDLRHRREGTGKTQVQPDHPGPGPPRRQLPPLPARHRDSPRHRGSDYRDLRRQDHLHGLLPADHHAHRPPGTTPPAPSSPSTTNAGNINPRTTRCVTP
ncbi:transposase domain-containing protein [Streptomyces sp. Inha503]|uniref:transposase domain-containing protein n=1 Tax=Streptomyces sp. Inha503 TaxID=3383314 RepID=UPI0039A3100E